MLIKTSPYCPIPARDGERTINRLACLAIMKELDVGSADGVNHDSAVAWSNTFYGSVPTLNDLVRVAEAHGFDVVSGVEKHGSQEWSATFVAVVARDPWHIERLIREEEDERVGRAQDIDVARQFVEEQRAIRLQHLPETLEHRTVPAVAPLLTNNNSSEKRQMKTILLPLKDLDAMLTDIPATNGNATITTSTGVVLGIGVPTLVGVLRVTTTIQVDGIALAHVEGPREALSAANIRRRLGRASRMVARTRNWVPGRGYFSEWWISGATSTPSVVARGTDPAQVALLMSHAHEWMPARA